VVFFAGSSVTFAPIAVPRLTASAASAVPLSAADPPRDRAALAVLVDARWCAARLEAVRLMALGLPNQDVEVVGHAIIAMP
jgi:hypothetical protein